MTEAVQTPEGFYRVTIAYCSGGSSMVYMSGRLDLPMAVSKLINEEPQVLRFVDIDGCHWFVTRAEIASMVISHFPGLTPTTAQHAHVVALKRDEQRAEAACQAEGITFKNAHDEGELPGEKPIAPKDRPN